MTKNKWKLKDVIMMAILGVVFAVVYLGVFNVGTAISVALTPYGLSAFSYEIIYGVWFMAATLAAFIIRKPGVALLCEFLAAFIELLLGNSGGVLVLITGLVQGVACELGFAVFRYRKYDLAPMCAAGIFAAIFTFVEEFILYDYASLSPVLLTSQVVVRMISAVVFAGLITKACGIGLAKTGVLKNYALGETIAEVEVVED